MTSKSSRFSRRSDRAREEVGASRAGREEEEEVGEEGEEEEEAMRGEEEVVREEVRRAEAAADRVVAHGGAAPARRSDLLFLPSLCGRTSPKVATTVVATIAGSNARSLIRR